MADGRIEKIGPSHETLRNERAKIDNLIRAKSTEMAERWPPGLLKRWPGYGIERFLRAPNLNEILAGSEGTLAAIFSAELKISPLPREKGLGLIFFASIDEAMQATVALLDLKPAAIEHIDRPLLDQTKGQLLFQPARDLMELDAKPCNSILLVEFYEDVAERLSILQSRKLGLRSKTVTDAAQMNLAWSVRKAGLSLLTGRVGPAKPVAFIEDAAVRPAQLPEYVRGLEAIMKPLGLEASYYGHAATGLLHVRPVLDLHDAGDLKKFRQVADQTSALVRQFKGSLSAEHGVGIARTEYMGEQLGDLLEVMRAIKRTFDPKNIFNPGKIFSDGCEPHGRQHKIDNHLRDNFTAPIELSFEPVLAFAFKDRSFIGNLEQCNGCGGCRKDAPMMCPTFVATGDEVMSTRGRANIIRAALQLRINGHDPLKSAELDAALSNCLACKGCTPECPSNVNLALLKAEMSYARYRRDGLPLRERVLSNADLLGRIGCAIPKLTNAIVDLAPLRAIMEKSLGLSAKRSLPHYTRERFDRWFEKHSSVAALYERRTNNATVVDRRYRREKVILWDDTFVRYNEPHIGIAAVRVLEALGFEVSLAQDRQCCGRPAFSQGNLDFAAELGRHNVELMNRNTGVSPAGATGIQAGRLIYDTPILFLEPSCYSMFVEDYRELKIPNAEKLAKRCFLFEKFVDDLLAREPNALHFHERQEHVAIHAHCHAKSFLSTGFMAQLVERLPGRTATLLDTGCCGMAGAFGMLAEKYDLSVQVAADLLNKIDNQPSDATVIASGTSCRHQISDLSATRPKHMAELIAEAIV
jgi:Fe-S oxidoreductase